MRYLKVFICTSLLIAVSLFAVQNLKAQQANGNPDFGLGVILGEPTGISAKKWTSSENALAVGAAWSFENNETITLFADYLWHRRIAVDSGDLSWYFGLGGRTRFSNDSALGVRVPFGLNYFIKNSPLEVFF